MNVIFLFGLGFALVGGVVLFISMTESTTAKTIAGLFGATAFILTTSLGLSESSAYDPQYGPYLGFIGVMFYAMGIVAFVATYKMPAKAR